MDSFAQIKTEELTRLKNSTDVMFLKKELERTYNHLPECAAESLWRTNKLSIIQNRLLTLKTGACKSCS